MKSEVGQLNKTVSGFAPDRLLVGPCTCSLSNRQLVPCYITLSYSAFVAVLMLIHIFNNNNYCNFGWALFRISYNYALHYD